MKKYLTGLVVAVLLVGITSISHAAIFTDTFDDPAYTNSHWQDGTPGVPQTWSFMSLNGSDLGYHATVDSLSTTEPAAKYLDTGEYFNADLYIELLVRIDSHSASYTVDENKVFFNFGASVANGESYMAGINIDNSGITASTLFLNTHTDTPSSTDSILAVLPVSIDFDTFYKLAVQVDSDQNMEVFMYDLNDALLGSVSSPKAITANKGFVAIGGRYASTFNNFYLSGTEVPIPAAVWLFSSGLVGLTRVARRKVRI